MKKTLYLSHFTPSMMNPQILEDLLVQRENILKHIVDQVAASVLTEAKHHNLFIGSRGIGKTHLLSLLHHRLTIRKDLKSKSLIAWLREEEWGVTSFLELLLRILKTLDQAYPALEIAARIADIYELKPSVAQAAAETLLLETLRNKTLVLLIENLDDLFAQLKDTGQRNWRAFLQNHAACTMVATAPALFAGVSRQKSPFYGFFRTELLKPLELDDVVELLGKIALARNDPGLAKAINSPHGRARLRAIHHLAEGNPRIYIIFAQFLTEQTLETLVDAFLHTLDELTPYYQARMKELSGQQRKIVEFLCNYRGAAPVKEIAKGCFITQQTCSSQLKELREKGYAKSRELGRESYYEMTEPLMRICLDVKKQRGEPIGLFVQILRIWYSQPELTAWLAKLGDGDCIDKTYVTKALELANKESTDPKLTAIQKDFETALNKKDFSRCKEILEDWRVVQPKADDEYLFSAWRMGIASNNLDEAAEAAHQMHEINSKTALILLIASYDLQGNSAKVLEFSGEAKKIECSLTGSNLGFLHGLRGNAYARLARHREAIYDFGIAQRLDKDRKCYWLNCLQLSYSESGDSLRCLKTLQRLSKLEPNNPEWLLIQVGHLRSLGHEKQAFELAQELGTKRFAETALGRATQVMNGKGDFDWVRQAPDYKEFSKNEPFHSIVVIDIVTLSKHFDPQLLESAAKRVLTEADADNLPNTLRAIFLLQSVRAASVAGMLNSLALTFEQQQTEVASAILGTLRFAVTRNNEDVLKPWLSSLRNAFPTARPEDPIGKSLMLVDTYINWQASGKEQILLRIPEEERKLLLEIAGDKKETEGH